MRQAKTNNHINFIPHVCGGVLYSDMPWRTQHTHARSSAPPTMTHLRCWTEVLLLPRCRHCRSLLLCCCLLCCPAFHCCRAVFASRVSSPRTLAVLLPRLGLFVFSSHTARPMFTDTTAHMLLRVLYSTARPQTITSALPLRHAPETSHTPTPLPFRATTQQHTRRSPPTALP